MDIFIHLIDAKIQNFHEKVLLLIANITYNIQKLVKTD
jgi:hypothetical protein